MAIIWYAAQLPEQGARGMRIGTSTAVIAGMSWEVIARHTLSLPASRMPVIRKTRYAGVGCTDQAMPKGPTQRITISLATKIHKNRNTTPLYGAELGFASVRITAAPPPGYCASRSG